jgi:NitT/TauT family transport system ATP-binding protein
MKQRCAIARSFSLNPPILLMDEPFGALDAVTRAKLQELVKNLWKKDAIRKTVFFVTHDVEEALLLGTRICVLGQSPSQIIYECKIDEEKKPERKQMYEDPEIMKQRNKLIEYINHDVARHIEE